MIDPMHSRLAQVHHAEQLKLAAAARERRATWTSAPRLRDRLRSALSTWIRTVRRTASVAGVPAPALPETDA